MGKALRNRRVLECEAEPVTHAGFQAKRRVYRPHLTISGWNIDGMKSATHGPKQHLDPFKDFIRKSDIAGIMETHGNQAQPLSLPGYYVHEQHRAKHGKAVKHSGGIAVAIKMDIKAGVDILPTATPDIAWLRLNKSFFTVKDDMYVAYIYSSPQATTYTARLTKTALEQLRLDLARLPTGARILTIGDFNRRIGLRSEAVEYCREDLITALKGVAQQGGTSPRQSSDATEKDGEALLDLCREADLTILNGRVAGDTDGSFTCKKYNGLSVIDYALASRALIDQVTQLQVGKWNVIMSDHCFLMCTVQQGREETSPQAGADRHERERLPRQQPIYRFTFDAAGQQQYQAVLAGDTNQRKAYDLQCQADDLASNPTSQGAQALVDGVTNMLLQAAQESVSYKVSRPPSVRQCQSKKWYTAECEEAQAEVDRRATQVTDQLPAVQGAYSAKKRLKRVQQRTKRQYVAELIAKLSSYRHADWREYWDTLEELKSLDALAVQTDTGIDISKWTDHFSKLFRARGSPGEGLNSGDDPPRGLGMPQGCLTQQAHEAGIEMDARIQGWEVQRAADRLKTGKSHYFDNICNEMIKYGMPATGGLITKVFQVLYETACYPESWAQSYIVPIHKKGALTEPGNYRGIAISSCLGKLFHGVLNKRLETFMEEAALNSAYQNGFQRDRRTSDNVFVLTTLLEVSSQKGQPVYAAFLDLKKAYDSVDRSILLQMLKAVGAGEGFIQTLEAMYARVQYCVRTGGKHGHFFASGRGLKQGDPMSCLLFNFYITFLPLFLNRQLPGQAQLNGLPLDCILFADDVVVLSTTREGLERRLELAYQFYTAQRLEINEAKSNVVIFQQRAKGKKLRTPEPPIHMGPLRLQVVDQMVYLGMQFNAQRTLTQLNEVMNGKALRATFKLQGASHNNLPAQLATKLFQQLIQPILMYGAEVWAPLLHPRAIRTNGLETALTGAQTLKADHIQIGYYRRLLGLNNNAAIMGIRGELGAYPMYIPAIQAAWKYHARVRAGIGSPLIAAALAEQDALVEQGRHCWLSNLQRIGEDMDLPLQTLPQVLKSCLRDRFEETWKESLHRVPKKKEQGNKLRTYREFKTTFEVEPYLQHPSRGKRNKLLQFRISAHRLRIETGRHERTPLAQRTCELCLDEAIQDEYHLFQCGGLQQLRLKHEIQVATPEDFHTLMQNPTATGPQVMDYVYQALEKAEAATKRGSQARRVGHGVGQPNRPKGRKRPTPNRREPQNDTPEITIPAPAPRVAEIGTRATEPEPQTIRRRKDTRLPVKRSRPIGGKALSASNAEATAQALVANQGIDPDQERSITTTQRSTNHTKLGVKTGEQKSQHRSGTPSRAKAETPRTHHRNSPTPDATAREQKMSRRSSAKTDATARALRQVDQQQQLSRRSGAKTDATARAPHRADQDSVKNEATARTLQVADQRGAKTEATARAPRVITQHKARSEVMTRTQKRRRKMRRQKITAAGRTRAPLRREEQPRPPPLEEDHTPLQRPRRTRHRPRRYDD